MNNHTQMYRDVTAAFGPPGFEHEVRDVIRKYVEPHADELQTDNLGGLMAVRHGKDPNIKLLFLAHMDECGFMVRSVTKEGYLRFLALGGWHPNVVLGQRVVVKTAQGPVHGVVGAKPPHEMKDEERKKAPDLDDFWIDVGVSENYNPAKELGIRPGDPIVPFGTYQETANPNIHIAPNWDNRVGCITLLRIFEALSGQQPPCTVIGAFSVQEEVGLRGAGPAAWLTEPNVAIALDVSIAHDTPIDSNADEAKLGGGAAILVFDSSMVPHLALRNHLGELAEQQEIPHHYCLLKGGGYDTGAAHRVRGGVPSCVLGIPSRYIHGFGAMIHLEDIESVTQLSCAAIQSLDQSTWTKLQPTV